MMTHGDKRRLFTLNIAFLTMWAWQQGFSLSIDAAKEDRDTDYSLHPHGLAVDMNLYFKRYSKRYVSESNPMGECWAYQQGTMAHYPLGQYWKALHPDNRWGGDFEKPAKKDGNHYSMTHWGKA